MDQSIIRITKELSDLQKGNDLSLAVACRDVDVRNIRALVLGPHGTPYEFGFFEFAVKFDKEYPSKPPNIRCITTNCGQTRFNPNIYANGKVCLSILGTWRGERGEEWSSAQGLESVLLSIQSLMSNNPYENEPGFECTRDDKEKEKQEHYRSKIRHETLRISVINRLESYMGLRPDGTRKTERSNGVDEESGISFEPFKDLCKRRFLWYYDVYYATIQKGIAETKDGQHFVRMPFEASGSNSIEGKFAYGDLAQRLENIKKALVAEEESWAAEGLASHAREETVGVNLSHQFYQVQSFLKSGDMPHSIELVNGNPFTWVMTYFGRPMTYLDGGLFKIKIVFSPRFPDEQPRIRFETNIFHHLITSDGVPCYITAARKREDARAHIDAIMKLLEEDEPAYDPRKTVNVEATDLFWGNDEKKKRQYNRRLRRSAQESMEEFPE